MKKWILIFTIIFPVFLFSYQFYYNQMGHKTYRVFSASIQNLTESYRKATIEQAYEAILRTGEVKDGEPVLFNGEYRTSARVFGSNYAYEAEDEKVYHSLFQRDKLGRIKSLSSKDFYPVVRSVPLFLDKDIKIGQTWTNTGMEVQDFRLLGYKDPFMVPFKSEYVYVEDVFLKQEELEKLTNRYKTYEFTIAGESQSLMNEESYKKDPDQKTEYAIIGVIYRVNYNKNDYPQQTQAIKSLGAIPVERAFGYYKGLIFWNKKTREEVFSLGEYNFTYTWENREQRNWQGKEYGYVDIFDQDAKEIDKLEKEAKSSLDKSIEVTKQKEGIKLIFGDLLFNFNKVNLRKEVVNVLDQVVNFLKKYPKAFLRISGHSDDIGTEDAKLKISQGRAKAVSEFLMSHGINPERIVFSGKADKEPRFANDSPANRKKNRRVELEVVTQ